MFNLNVKSPFFTVKESKYLLEKGTNPNVLLVSSVTGTEPNQPLGVYGMTKACLNNLGKWLGQELMDDGIRVNTISPGLIQTEFAGVLWKDNKELPPNSLGKPEEIAAVTATICSDGGKFMNCSNTFIHGGYPKL